MRQYLNETNGARAAVSEILSLVATERPEILGFDVETSPAPGLEGYPGSQVDEDGNPIKANKKTYLEFAQKLWRAAFQPIKLQALGLYLPQKTISGKEGERTAQEAWQHLSAMLLLTRDADLETARWTEDAIDAHQQALLLKLAPLEAELREKECQIATMTAAGTVRGLKTFETVCKRLRGTIALLENEYAFISTNARAALKTPVDLRLLKHVLAVGVEGRCFLNSSGQNRLDPVKPGLDPRTSTIFLVQFTLRDRAGGLNSWIFNTNPGKVALTELLPVFQLPTVTFAGANIKFDLAMLMHHLGYAPKQVFCTRVASRMLYLGLRMSHSLADVAERFLGYTLDKEARSTFVGRRYDEPTQEQLQYAYLDTEILPALVDAQLAKARTTGQEQLIRDFSRLSWITAKWEHDGYRIDRETWLDIAKSAAQSRDAVARELERMLLPKDYFDQLAGGVHPGLAPDQEGLLVEEDDDESSAVDVRPNAIVRISQTKMVGELLSGVLGMPVPSLAKQARSTLEREYRLAHGGQGHPFFQQYSQWSKLAKQASTYGVRFLWFLHPLTGKVHPSFQIAGTDTGRYTSTAPNLLNIPAAKEPGDPDFRGAFLSDEGHYWLGADYETMELRIAGDLARDPMVKQMAESGADAHGFTAVSMFHIEAGDVAEPVVTPGVYNRAGTEYDIRVWRIPQSWSPEQAAQFALTDGAVAALKAVKAQYGKDITRGDAKSVTFLWLFQGTAYTLAERTGLSLDHCDQLFAKFAQVYRRMDGYLKQTAEDGVTRNVIVGEDGRRFGFSVGYGGIRRYAPLPVAPYERDFPSYGVYYVAAKEYKRQVRRVQRELCNLPMQGGNAVITCGALLRMVEEGERLGVFPKLAIYDEVIAQAPLVVRPVLAKGILERAMLGAADEHMVFVPAGAEADLTKAGCRWVKS